MDKAKRAWTSTLKNQCDKYGPNDIPCFSMINRWGGTSIGVTAHETFTKGFELARGNRTTVGPYEADYSNGSQLRKAIEAAINEIGNEISS